MEEENMCFNICITLLKEICITNEFLTIKGDGWGEILKKVLHPNYENELGNKYFLRHWSKL